MADTPSTGNTTPTVDPAAPTDTTTDTPTAEQTTDEAVQLAAAHAVQVSSPGPRAQQTIIAEADQTYQLTGPVGVLRYTKEGPDGALLTIIATLSIGNWYRLSIAMEMVARCPSCS